MTIKKTLLTAALVLSGLAATAQEPVEEYEYVFNPHWYGQVQFGIQETLGENKFGDLLAPNAQLAAGYQFTDLFGARLSLNSWQSKASIDFQGRHNWKWNYIAPMIDGTFNLTNLIGGFNPNRLVDVNVLAGIGVNIGYKNKEANRINDELSKAAGFQVLRNNWTGTKARFVFRMGASIDFRVAEAWKVGLELQANTLPDGYNSKRAGNSDWYFNGLVGVKYTFGKSHSKRKKAVVAPAVVVEEKIVEKIVEVPTKVEVVKEVQEPITRDIFFTISHTNISVYEMEKVKAIAEYLKANPNAKVNITGFADKGTGSLRLNMQLAEKRANAVAKALTDKFGIAADRIKAAGMSETATPPFTDPVLNRVAVCITED
ncbi:MAG: OmpA family protein [Candidatus Homeothermus sp.]|nr:OmpA family protein [Candidatus Homeothermus sp.]